MQEKANLSGIPVEEQEKFARHLYRYRNGDEIIQEGQTDTALYLLRVGEVGVFKNMPSGLKQISTIAAINLFGEIAAITASERTATIRVTSDTAVVYKFPATDLRNVYANPAWSELLISRLCNDLKEANSRNVNLDVQLTALSARQKRFEENTTWLLAAWIRLQNKVSPDLVINAKEWVFLSAMRDLIQTFAKNYLPELYNRINDEGLQNAAVEKMIRRDILPEFIKSNLPESNEKDSRQA